MRARVRKLPKRSDPPPVTKRRNKSTVITVPMTKAERRKAGYRDTCDICHAKINKPLSRGKKVQIWSFTVKGAKGKIFNRCKRHLKTKVKI